MEKYVAILLLVPVLLDAVGDAFRYRGWLISHHTMETLHVAFWVWMWAFYGFQVEYIYLYVLGRIVLFDIAFNLVAGLSIWHVGKNSIYDLLLRWFGGIVKQYPGHFAFMTRLIALLFWIKFFIQV